MVEGEQFKWSKLFSGLVNPLNFAKSFVLLIQASIIVTVVSCVVFSIIWFGKQTVWKPKPVAQPITINAAEGKVYNNSGEVKKKYSIVGLF